MTYSEACEAQNKLYKALNALLELPGDKHRQAINDLRYEISYIDNKVDAGCQLLMEQ
jgi:hypothetical protein